MIESKGLNPPKSHDLIMLYGHVDEMVELEEDTLAKMNQVYIDARYPASLGAMPEGLPDDDDAADFYEFAEAVFSKVKAVLKEII